MHFSKMIRGAACAAPFLLAACGGSESSFDLVLVHKDCEVATGESVLPATGTVKISVTGDGIGSPISATADVGSHSLDVPEIPPGSNRVATVEVCDDSSCRSLRAYGRSAPFDVSEDGGASVEVQMYRVNGFTRTRVDGGACSKLATERAGHTATLLSDGRVLLAGGFRIIAAGLQATDVLQSAEIFDPVSGTFTSAGNMCDGDVCMPRAFGQAVLLRDGRVLLVGGVDETGNPTASAILFDPKTNGWTAAPSMAHARHGHTATLLGGSTGQVVIVGGVDAEGMVQGDVEVFDRDGFRVVKNGNTALSVPRAFHAATAVGTGNQAVKIVGGIDADGKVLATARVVRYEQATGGFAVGDQTGALEVGVAQAGLAPFSNRIVAVGGASKWSQSGVQAGFGMGTDPIKEVQWFDRVEGGPAKGSITGQAARLAPCVAILGDDDRALVVGGFSTNGTTPLTKAEVLGMRNDVLSSSLTENQGKLRDDTGRGFATCTSLGNGRVLVAGGIGSGNKAVSTAEIYVAQKAN